jgi:hypothetical protein
LCGPFYIRCGRCKSELVIYDLTYRTRDFAFPLDFVSILTDYCLREIIVVGLSIRVDFDSRNRVGPGKIQLLEQIAALGSISAGGRALDMSYRRAWELIDELNSAFGQPRGTIQNWGKKGWRGVPHTFWLKLNFSVSGN